MKRFVLLIALILLSTGAAAQSLGVGAGLAIPSSAVAELPSSIRSDGWTAVEGRAERGYFIEIRGRFGGDLAVTGALSYNRFLDARSDYSDGSGRSVTLISTQAIVPLSVGLEQRFGDELVTPFATLEGTLSYFYRGYESPSGGMPVPFRIESSGQTRYGLALGAGASLDVPLLRLDALVRAQVVNLFGDAPEEATVYYLQAGLSAWFGL